MTIYIDTTDNFKCHISDDGTMLAYETDAFEGKCQTYIEGYRVVPDGYTWTREDGVEFTGEMIAPWRDYTILEAAQAAYEEAQSQAMTAYVEGVNAAYEQ